MADDALLAKVHGLSDLELAVLLCLVSREHGLLSSPAAAVDDLVDELQLVASQTFGLGCVVVDCAPDTTLEQFASALLCAPGNGRHSNIPSLSPFTVPRPDSSYFGARPPRHHSWGSSASPLVPPAGIANCDLARHLDRAPRAVQIQALELLRTRRIFTRTAVQTAPRPFVFLPVVAADCGGQARVTDHLNDFFSLAHWHDPDDGFANLDEADDAEAADDTASTGSVVRSRLLDVAPSNAPLISEADIKPAGAAEPAGPSRRRRRAVPDERRLLPPHAPRRRSGHHASGDQALRQGHAMPRPAARARLRHARPRRARCQEGLPAPHPHHGARQGAQHAVGQLAAGGAGTALTRRPRGGHRGRAGNGPGAAVGARPFYYYPAIARNDADALPIPIQTMMHRSRMYL